LWFQLGSCRQWLVATVCGASGLPVHVSTANRNEQVRFIAKSGVGRGNGTSNLDMYSVYDAPIPRCRVSSIDDAALNPFARGHAYSRQYHTIGLSLLADHFDAQWSSPRLRARQTASASIHKRPSHQTLPNSHSLSITTPLLPEDL